MIALLVRLEFYPVLGIHSPYLPFILAVVVAARFGGLLAGLTATALSALSAVWFFLAEQGPAAFVALSLFALTGTIVSILVGRLRAAYVATARAEEALARQSQLIELSHDAIITMDFDRRVVKWNAGAKEMYGWAEHEAAGRVIHELFQTPAGSPDVPVDEILVRAGQWNGELSQVTRDGRRLVVESRQVLIRDENGLPAGILEIDRDITGRKRAQDAMRESEERFRIAQQVARIGTFEWNIETDVNQWTPEMEAMHGLPPGGFKATRGRWQELIHPDDRAKVAQLVQQAFDTGTPTEGEWRVVWPDGSVRWLTGRWQVFKDTAGRPLRMIGVNLDVTERRRAEARLKESESFHRQVLESIPGMVFTTRPDGHCDYQSQQWVEYTGVPMSEQLGDGWNMLLHPDDRPRALAAWRTAVEDRTSYDLEYRVRRCDGAYEWFKVAGRPIRDSGGRIVRWFGVALKIEEIKRAEQALREALEYRQLALETAKLGVWDYRLDSGEVLWDEQSGSIFGLAGTNLIHYSDLLARVHADDRAAMDRALKQAIAAANEGAYRSEFRVVWPDGSVHWVASHGRVLFEGEGGRRRPVRLVGVNMEITERRRADERLRQAQKLESIGLLAGGVAHDFNNLLTVIMGNASAALAQCPSCEHSRAILAASERAAYLTKQLLAYAGKGRFISRKFDISDVVSKAEQLVSASIPKRVRVAFHLAGNLPPIDGDPAGIEQILMNLTINAGEAIPPKTDGRIEVETGMCNITPEIAAQQSHAFEVRTGPHVYLEVRDNGAGMDGTTLSRIFDPFFSTKFAGRGLGLAAVHGIVRGSKGFIDVQSSPGSGSTFRVFLPAVEREDATDALNGLPAKAAHREFPAKATILVVDDEELVRQLVCMTLKGHGYEVLEAKDGQDAFQVLAGCVSIPALVLLDLAMPAMGGDELVPVLKQKYPDLKIVVSSGYPEDQVRESFPAGDVVTFLQKPYGVTTLLEMIRESMPGAGHESP